MDWIPDWARREALDFELWQWIGLFASILLGLLIKEITEKLHSVAKFVTKKSAVQFDDQIMDTLERPIGWIAASIFWLFSVHVLRFEGTTLDVLKILVQIVFSFAAVWTAYRAADVFTEYLRLLAEKTASPLDDSLIPLLRKALKIFTLVIGVLVAFQNLGVNVMSVLAGLGLGGLAFALAARDTCANLFGSIMIFLDRPFRVGDWIITGEVEGTVEEVGFRSTRVRTFYNSLISVPNSKLANQNIDNMGLRKYRRIRAILGVTYDTGPEHLEAFLEGIKNIIKANPHTRKDYFHVCFTEYGASSLNVMIYCFLKVPSWAEELVERQNIYIEIYRLAKKLGIEFAFPTQTLHMESFPEKDPTRVPKVRDPKDLAQLAKNFGPNGSDAQPSGRGLFQPPYRESQ